MNWRFEEQPVDITALREAVRARPFRPFRLRLADGREIPIPHPEYVAVAANGRRVVAFNPDDDSMSILEPFLIVSAVVFREPPSDDPR
jgi:hypothetical protein